MCKLADMTRSYLNFAVLFIYDCETECSAVLSI